MSVKVNKSCLKHSAIFAALLGCSALSVPLGASAAAPVSAKTSWAIHSVENQAGEHSGGSYCTMAQKYADETVLTFGENLKGEYSLALDFKDKKFTPGEKESVSVAVDGYPSKSFSSLPRTQNTIVLNLGNQSDFINQISKARKLKVKMDSESSDFGLSDFGAGRKEMALCMEGLRNPAHQVVASVEPKNIEEVKAEQNGEPSVEKLLAAAPKPSGDMTSTEPEIVPLKPVVAGASPSPALKAKPISSLNHQMVTAKNADALNTDALEVEMASLRDENEKLSRMLSEQRKVLDEKKAEENPQAFADLQKKLEGVTSENQALKTQVEKYSSAEAQKAVSAESVAKLQSENNQLKKEIDDLKLAAQKAATVPVPTPVISDEELSKLRADNRKLADELAVLKTEKDSLQGESAQLRKDLEGKQLKLSGGNWDLEQATRRYQESQREIVRLGALIQSKDAKCTTEKKDIEYMLFDPAIATKAQISMLNDLERQIKEKDEKLKALETELASVRAQVSPDKDTKIAELQKSVEEAKGAVAEKTKLLVETQEKMQQTNQSATLSVSQKEAELNSLKVQLAESQKTIARLEGEISAAQAKPVNVAAAVPAAPKGPVLDPMPLAPSEAELVKANETPLVNQPPVMPSVGEGDLVPRFQSAQDIASLLNKAGIGVEGRIQEVKGGDPSSYRAYSWKTDRLYGSAEMRRISGVDQFDSAVTDYLDRAKSRCSGDFAAVPSPVKSASSQSQAYEIACVGQSSSSSASVLFTYGDRVATIVAHEGPAEIMDLAIDARDKLSSEVNHSY